MLAESPGPQFTHQQNKNKMTNLLGLLYIHLYVKGLAGSLIYKMLEIAIIIRLLIISLSDFQL